MGLLSKINEKTPTPTPKQLSTFHLVTTVIWGLLVVPTVLWWGESVLWVALMSVWANFVGHWSAYQASRAEVKQDEANGNGDGDG
jgi:hypothetical protein